MHPITSKHIHPLIHGSHLVGCFNAWLAVRVTNSVGTMWAAYLFCLIAMASFPAALVALLHGDILTAVMWLSQSFLQLVLLPVLLVGQRVDSAAQDARAEADHERLSTLESKLDQLLAVVRPTGEQA